MRMENAQMLDLNLPLELQCIPITNLYESYYVLYSRPSTFTSAYSFNFIQKKRKKKDSKRNVNVKNVKSTRRRKTSRQKYYIKTIKNGKLDF